MLTNEQIDIAAKGFRDDADKCRAEAARCERVGEKMYQQGYAAACEAAARWLEGIAALGRLNEKNEVRDAAKS